MKKLLLMAVVTAMTAVPVLAQERVAAPIKQEPCPIAHRETFKAEDVRPDCKQRPPHFDMKKFEDELKLTDKQKAQLKDMREKRMEAAKPLHEKLQALEKEACEVRKELRELRIQGKKDFESVLTDKQLKKLEKMKAERKAEFAKRHPDGFHHKRMPRRFDCGRPCPLPLVEE